MTLDATAETIVQTVPKDCATIRSCRFISIIDVAGADYPAREKRFDVVYHLLSPTQNVCASG